MILRVLVACLACLSSLSADVLTIPNQSPLTAIFGVPSPYDFSDQQGVMDVQFTVANHFVPRSSRHEFLLLDGETRRLQISLQKELQAGWQLRAVIPFLRHSGGGLDSFVNDWHQFFGLPESGRPRVENDRLLFYYRVDDTVLLDITDPVSGLGDVSLQAIHHDAGQQNKILRLGVKLPTGEARSLLGSGAADGFIDYSRKLALSDIPLQLAMTAGLALLGKSHLFPQQQAAVVYASANAGLRLGSRWHALLQLALQSPVLESDLHVLSTWPLQALAGFSYQVKHSGKLIFALSEDPDYGTSSDVVLSVGWRGIF